MLEKLKALINENLGIDEAEIKEESNFIEDFGVDSLDLFEFVMTVEEEFDIKVASEDVAGLKTVADVMKYIEAHQ